MRSTTAAKVRAAKLESKSETTSAEKMEILELAISKRQKLAESDLDMAQVFIEKGKVAIARRRLCHIIDTYDGTDAAIEAQAMLKKLRPAP